MRIRIRDLVYTESGMEKIQIRDPGTLKSIVKRVSIEYENRINIKTWFYM
jgi:hypothetical protein